MLLVAYKESFHEYDWGSSSSDFNYTQGDIETLIPIATRLLSLPLGYAENRYKVLLFKDDKRVIEIGPNDTDIYYFSEYYRKISVRIMLLAKSIMDARKAKEFSDRLTAEHERGIAKIKQEKQLLKELKMKYEKEG